MRNPTRIDLVGDRGCTFAETITRVGVNLTGAIITAQVRLKPDASGSPLITIGVSLTYGGSATVGTHISAGRLTSDIYSLVNPATGVNYVSGDTVPVSVITLGVAADIMADDVPPTMPVGDDWVGAWDMLIDPDGVGSEGTDKWFYGEFRIRGTVTQ